MESGQPEAQRLAKLRWRCRRGMKELDVVLTRYLDRDYLRAATGERAAFEMLLQQPDPDILDYVLQRVTPKSKELANVVARLNAADR